MTLSNRIRLLRFGTATYGAGLPQWIQWGKRAHHNLLPPVPINRLVSQEDSSQRRLAASECCRRHGTIRSGPRPGANGKE